MTYTKIGLEIGIELPFQDLALKLLICMFAFCKLVQKKLIFGMTNSRAFSGPVCRKGPENESKKPKVGCTKGGQRY